MPMQGQIQTLNQMPGLWLESRRMAQEEENAKRNYLLANRNQLGDALAALIGSLNQYQVQQQQLGMQQQGMDLEGRRVAALEQDTASQIAARGVQSGKTAAETESILKQLGYADELIRASLAQTYAETEGVKAGTEATRQDTRGKRLMLPGQILQQGANIQATQEGTAGARQDRLQDAALFGNEVRMGEAELAETKARTGLLGAQTRAAGQAPAGPETGGWQRSVQEEITGVENAATARMTQINAILGNKSVVDVMMATPQGKAAIEQMTQDAAAQQARLAQVNEIRRMMANAQEPMTEDQAWAMLGRLLAGQQQGGAQPVPNAGGSVGGAELRGIFK